MTGYHKQITIREMIAKAFYKLPILPVRYERFLALKLIPFIEGQTPRSRHLGKNCPCMKEKDDEV